MNRASLRVAPMNRFERRRERTRRDLLASATRVLAKKGLHDTKVADIAATSREGVASRAFAPVPPAVAAQAVVGMATQVLSWWTEQESLSMDTLQETMIELALHGLGARAPATGARRGGRSHG